MKNKKTHYQRCREQGAGEGGKEEETEKRKKKFHKKIINMQKNYKK